MQQGKREVLVGWGTFPTLLRLPRGGGQLVYFWLVGLKNFFFLLLGRGFHSEWQCHLKWSHFEFFFHISPSLCSYGRPNHGSSISSVGTVEYWDLSNARWTVLNLSFTTDIILFNMQGPIVKINNSRMRGPNREEIRVVNQGEVLNQDSTMIVHFLFLVFACLGLL